MAIFAVKGSKMKKKNLELLNDSPTAFNATKNIVEVLEINGYHRLKANEKIIYGGKYYVTKNNSSIMAFNIGENFKKGGFNIVASHLDCPSFKLKPEALIVSDGYLKLNTEGYGGMIMSTWLDRPLSLAGRVITRSAKGIKINIVNIKENLLLIPNVAIHMNRDINNGYKYNPKDDLIPLLGLGDKLDFNSFISDKCGLEGEVLSYDLYLYPRIDAYTWGLDNELLSAFHIDNLGCALTSLEAFITTECKENINVYVSFDNEEVGSLTAQGADSTLMFDYLTKISDDLGLDYLELIDNSLLISADNAHAHHPNHPEYSDRINHAYINKGLVIKYHANQAYTSDALSVALFTTILNRVSIPYQFFTNRADLRGGSTLGNISNAHVSLRSIDIGLPQLAMHSSLETCGSHDWEDMIRALSEFYQTKIINNDDGTISI